MSMITDALDRALQKKIGLLYDNLFNALAIAGSAEDEVTEAEQAFLRGLKLAKHSHQIALQLSDT